MTIRELIALLALQNQDHQVVISVKMPQNQDRDYDCIERTIHAVRTMHDEEDTFVEIQG